MTRWATKGRAAKIIDYKQRLVPSEVLQEPKEDKSVEKINGQSKFYN